MVSCFFWENAPDRPRARDRAVYNLTYVLRTIARSLPESAERGRRVGRRRHRGDRKPSVRRRASDKLENEFWPHRRDSIQGQRMRTFDGMCVGFDGAGCGADSERDSIVAPRNIDRCGGRPAAGFDPCCTTGFGRACGGAAPGQNLEPTNALPSSPHRMPAAERDSDSRCHRGTWAGGGLYTLLR